MKKININLIVNIIAVATALITSIGWYVEYTAAETERDMLIKSNTAATKENTEMHKDGITLWRDQMKINGKLELHLENHD